MDTRGDSKKRELSVDQGSTHLGPRVKKQRIDSTFAVPAPRESVLEIKKGAGRPAKPIISLSPFMFIKVEASPHSDSISGPVLPASEAVSPSALELLANAAVVKTDDVDMLSTGTERETGEPAAPTSAMPIVQSFSHSHALAPSAASEPEFNVRAVLEKMMIGATHKEASLDEVNKAAKSKSKTKYKTVFKYRIFKPILTTAIPEPTQINEHSSSAQNGW